MTTTPSKDQLRHDYDTIAAALRARNAKVEQSEALQLFFYNEEISEQARLDFADMVEGAYSGYASSNVVATWTLDLYLEVLRVRARL
jgi:hypothetical protein